MDAFFGGRAGAARAAARARGSPRPGRPDPARDRPRRGGVRRPPASSRSTPRCSARPATARAPHRAPDPVACETCHGRGEVAPRAALVPRPGPDACAVRGLPGLRQLIPEPCRECSGDGRVRSRRTLTVKVPAGVDTGTRVQLAGQGEVGPGGGPAGDLYVEVARRPTHAVFIRHGDDLHCTVTLPMTAAALGVTLTLPTLEADLARTRPPRRLARRRDRCRRDPARHPVRRRDRLPRARASRPARRRPRRPRRPRDRGDARPGSTTSRRSCCAELARLRGEETPDGQVANRHHKGGVRPAARRLRTADDAWPMHFVPPRGRLGRGRRRRSRLDGEEGHHAAVVRRIARRRAGRAHRRRGSRRRGAGSPRPARAR